MQKMDLSLLRQKFRGSILGALIGDCLGSPYENEDMLTTGEKIVLQKAFDKLEGPEFKAPVKQFTDDSAMTMNVAQSLVEHQDLNLVDMAKKFVKSYYREPHRGYGPGVVTVFKKLRGNKFSDLIKPASEQFDGTGSMGNGGAMRVSPIALFCYNNYDRLIDMTKKATQLTHTHKEGVNGAILQAIAVHQSLALNPNQPLDPIIYIDDLIKKMEAFEEDDEQYLDLDETEVKPYRFKLLYIKKTIDRCSMNNNVQDEEVIQNLGNNVTALDSVPTAIFCFLRAQYPVNGIKTDNPMRRAIQYAITLGGDTDTIASMTGAIAGAFYGDEKISKSLLAHCESSMEFCDIADRLFDVTVTNKN
ncbi:ADP-ribose glycohydrolase ARH3-like [Chelonus insularis]|uniref:ADP-ribose glycohydrolase ARH3-like n=1 Tax=Chelonus insularis TaxID=460826 RepID=UPI00158D6A94|nr:ADP-ribose glycohydrolase ARH3-like [Chelonus insularis]XP_034944046.1 ADP-ribose glycohydrolase ARH3-like [Chelonus insularis]